MDNDIQLLTDPSYSPDLALFDFFLFPRMKNEIRVVTLVQNGAYRGCLEGLKPEDWAYFEKWFERMHKCISYNGGNFEQLFSNAIHFNQFCLDLNDYSNRVAKLS